MSLEPKFKVPFYVKAIFSSVAVAMLLGLVSYQVSNRRLYRELRLAQVMRPALLPGIDVPPISFQMGEIGPSITLGSFEKRWILLNFWATWCPPCRAEMPSLELLHRAMSDELVVLTVSVDENWEDVKRFFADRVPSFPMAWDRTREAAGVFGVVKFPETFLISPDHKIWAKFSGARDWSSPEAIAYFQKTLSSRRTSSALNHS